MRLHYVIYPKAEEDLEDIWAFTAREWSAKQAADYTNDIINMFEDIASGSQNGRSVLVRDGYRKVLIGGHAIYFRRDDGMIAIVRILHQSMDVERHL